MAQRKFYPVLSTIELQQCHVNSISIFNNNGSFLSERINSSSNITYYNFKTDKIKYFGSDIFSTWTEGKQTK